MTTHELVSLRSRLSDDSFVAESMQNKTAIYRLLLREMADADMANLDAGEADNIVTLLKIGLAMADELDKHKHLPDHCQMMDMYKQLSVQINDNYKVWAKAAEKAIDLQKRKR